MIIFYSVTLLSDSYIISYFLTNQKNNISIINYFIYIIRGFLTYNCKIKILLLLNHIRRYFVLNDINILIACFFNSFICTFFNILYGCL